MPGPKKTEQTDAVSTTAKASVRAAKSVKKYRCTQKCCYASRLWSVGDVIETDADYPEDRFMIVK